MLISFTASEFMLDLHVACCKFWDGDGINIDGDGRG